MTSSTDEPQRWIAAGRVGRPHGLDGSFHVTHARARLLEVGLRLRVVAKGAAREETFVVTRKAGTERDPILRLEGAQSREAALSLRGSELLVSMKDAPALPEGEWWADEFEGCAVKDGEIEVGTVQRLVELPSCEALEVRRPSGGILLVPLVKDAVRTVDVDGGQIDVDLRFLGEVD